MYTKDGRTVFMKPSVTFLTVLCSLNQKRWVYVHAIKTHKSIIFEDDLWVQCALFCLWRKNPWQIPWSSFGLCEILISVFSIVKFPKILCLNLLWIFNGLDNKKNCCGQVVREAVNKNLHLMAGPLRPSHPLPPRA